MKKPSKNKKTAFVPLSVKPLVGELVRFLVGSRTAAGREYLVDLEANNFNGQCGCIHFEMKCQPMLNKGYPPCDALRCAHIRRCRSYVLDEVLPKIVKQLRKGNEHGNETISN